jgi:hypothetical protein
VIKFNIKNILNAANYENLCKFSIIPPEGKIFTNNILQEDSIIFCKTDFLDYLFENLKNSKYKYTLITHHSDYSIDEFIFKKKPVCIKKWFAINPTFIHDDLISIPLGIKTHTGIYFEEKYKTNWFLENIDNLIKNEKQLKLYCNWNNTNPYRNNVIEILKKNNLNYTHECNKPFEEYATNMSKHKFVISPPGNGIDCHRTWEALYMGCIPIVIKNYIYNSFTDLPILQLNDYSEITNNILDSFINKKFNYEKLTIDYWKNKVNLNYE